MDEQKMLEEFAQDMKELEKYADFEQTGNICTIKCKLGLWSETGEYGMPLINKAFRHFERHKKDGQYSVESSENEDFGLRM